MEDIGFLFSTESSKTMKTFEFPNFSVNLRVIDADPGHVQSGDLLTPLILLIITNA